MMNHTSRLHSAAMPKFMLVSAALLAGAALTGCGVATTTAAPAKVVVQGGTITGKAMGGQQPVTLGSVELWAASSGGYGTASTPLISTASNTVGSTTPVNTDANGDFTITSDFTCPSLAPDTPVYITITGGHPIGTGPNANLGLMAALGPCSNLVNIAFVNVNEITTVGSVWALSGFMTAYDHVGTSSTNMTGLSNAFATVNKLVNIGTGLPSGPTLPAGATLPSDEIYALANILATCVNSTGGDASNTGTNCGALFHYTDVGGAPTNTIDAAMNIAKYPANNVHNLFGLVTGLGAAFTTNETEPTSWTIAINYTGGGLNHPKGIAVDGNGNAWVPNAGTSQPTSSVTLLSATGATLTSPITITGITDSHINQPSALAVDGSNSAWITNTGSSTITRISPSGTVGSTSSGNGLSTPSGLAFDAAGNIWVSNAGANSVSAFDGTGTAIGTYSNVGGITTPVGITANPQ